MLENICGRSRRRFKFLVEMSNTLLSLTDDVRKMNIQGLSWFLILKYLKGDNNYSDNPLFLSVLTEYCDDCESPGDCLIFIKVLNLLVLTKQVERKRVERKKNDDELLVIIKNIYETAMELKEQCFEELQPSHVNCLNKILCEAKCQVIVSYLMFKDVDSALLQWNKFYMEPVPTTEHELSSQLKQILDYLSKGLYKSQSDEEMDLSINLFISRHEPEGLCRGVQNFVSHCCVDILHGRVKSNQESVPCSSDVQPGTSSITACSTSTSTSATVSRPKAQVQCSSEETGETCVTRRTRARIYPLTTAAMLIKHPVAVKRAQKFGKEPPSQLMEEISTGEEEDREEDLVKVKPSSKGRATSKVPRRVVDVSRGSKTTGGESDSNETEENRFPSREKSPSRRMTRSRKGFPSRRITRSRQKMSSRQESSLLRRVTRSRQEYSSIQESPSSQESTSSQESPSRRITHSTQVAFSRRDVSEGESCIPNGCGKSAESDSVAEAGSSTDGEGCSESPHTRRRQAGHPKDLVASPRKRVTFVNDDSDSEQDATDESTPISRLPERPPLVHFKPRKALMYKSAQVYNWNQQYVQLDASRMVATTKKVKFTTIETEDLIDGIARFGYGNWAKILAYYPFHHSRNKVSLKDKARNLRGREQ